MGWRRSRSLLRGRAAQGGSHLWITIGALTTHSLTHRRLAIVDHTRSSSLTNPCFPHGKLPSFLYVTDACLHPLIETNKLIGTSTRVSRDSFYVSPTRFLHVFVTTNAPIGTSTCVPWCWAGAPPPLTSCASSTVWLTASAGATRASPSRASPTHSSSYFTTLSSSSSIESYSLSQFQRRTRTMSKHSHHL